MVMYIVDMPHMHALIHGKVHYITSWWKSVPILAKVFLILMTTYYSEN